VTRACPATLALRRRMIEEDAEGKTSRLQQMWCRSRSGFFSFSRRDSVWQYAFHVTRFVPTKLIPKQNSPDMLEPSSLVAVHLKQALRCDKDFQWPSKVPHHVLPGEI
jgi:hypothetical protein